VAEGSPFLPNSTVFPPQGTSPDELPAGLFDGFSFPLFRAPAPPFCFTGRDLLELGSKATLGTSLLTRFLVVACPPRLFFPAGFFFFFFFVPFFPGAFSLWSSSASNFCGNSPPGRVFSFLLG